MAIIRPTSSPARMSLTYITVGCLTMIWTGVWYCYLLNHPPATESVYYWVAGLALTGATLVVIGLAVGQIGLSARHAESAPTVVTPPAVENGQAAPVATAVPSVPVASVPANVSPPVAGPPVNARSVNASSLS